MPINISKRLGLLTQPATVAITAKARELQRAGHDVITLSSGEPDFTPSPEVREAVAREAIEGITRYGASAGSPPLREAVSQHLQDSRGVKFTPEQVIITNGGKHAIFLAFAALVDPGDEVLIPAPYWVSYPSQVELMGGTPCFISGEDRNGFKISPEELRSAIVDETVSVVINNPSNPTGALYTREEISALTEVCVEEGCAIVSDEVYHAFIYEGGPFTSSAAVSPRAEELTVIAGSLSKTYAMPGWRIGFLAGPIELIRKAVAYQGHATHHVSSLSQAAAMAAFTGGQESVEEMRLAFLARRDYLLDAFSQLPGFDVASPPHGAFYIFPRITRLIEAIPECSGSINACEWLLEEALVALVPGIAFGAEGFLRISYAASQEELEMAVERIGNAVQKLEF
jgi:aspartate aminotransferase